MRSPTRSSAGVFKTDSIVYDSNGLIDQQASSNNGTAAYYLDSFQGGSFFDPDTRLFFGNKHWFDPTTQRFVSGTQPYMGNTGIQVTDVGGPRDAGWTDSFWENYSWYIHPEHNDAGWSGDLFRVGK